MIEIFDNGRRGVPRSTQTVFIPCRGTNRKCHPEMKIFTASALDSEWNQPLRCNCLIGKRLVIFGDAAIGLILAQHMGSDGTLTMAI